MFNADQARSQLLELTNSDTSFSSTDSLSIVSPPSPAPHTPRSLRTEKPSEEVPETPDMTSTPQISSSARGNQRAVLSELASLATQVTEHSQLTNDIHKTLQSMQATLIEQQQVIETLKENNKSQKRVRGRSRAPVQRKLAVSLYTHYLLLSR